MENLNEFIDYCSKLQNGVLEGVIDPIKAAKELKRAEKMAKNSYVEIELDLFTEVGKYEKNQLKDMGIETRNGGKTYSYKNVPEWVDQKGQLDSIQDKAKQAYQAAMNGGVFIDQDTGEVITPCEVTNRKDVIIFKNL